MPFFDARTSLSLGNYFWVSFPLLKSSLLLEAPVPSVADTIFMDQRKDAQTRLWIRDRDTLGNIVDLRLIEAAHRVWGRARLVVIRYLTEDTEAPEILEAAVDSASRAMGNDQSIQFFDAYLLRSVARESVRRLRKNKRVEYMDNVDLERLAGAFSLDLDRQLDEAKQIEVFRAYLDEQGRTMYGLRVLDFDWRSIARLTGYADAHSAEVQFRKKFARALDRFRANYDSRLKPHSIE
jgi:hypothetical protein